MDTKNKMFTVIGSIAILATSSIGGFMLFTTPDSPVTTTAQMSASTNVSTTSGSTMTGNSTYVGTTSTSAVATSSYKDGTYTAFVHYTVPHGGENSLSATVTIASGNITSVATNNSFSDGESSMYIDSFKNNSNSAVVGQSIGSISLSRIGGASLTTSAFSNVLDTIATQARA